MVSRGPENRGVVCPVETCSMLSYTSYQMTQHLMKLHPVEFLRMPVIVLDENFFFDEWGVKVGGHG
jgi:hypothetical protein